jgi:hypothetical protein
MGSTFICSTTIESTYRYEDDVLKEDLPEIYAAVKGLAKAIDAKLDVDPSRMEIPSFMSLRNYKWKMKFRFHPKKEHTIEEERGRFATFSAFCQQHRLLIDPSSLDPELYE